MPANSDKPLTLSVRQQDCSAIMTVGGSVDMANVDRLKQELVDLCTRSIPVIVLDLTSLEFICSLGLGAIILGHLKTRHHRGQIRLVNPQPSVLEVLETTKLTKVFPIFRTVELAMAG